MKERGNGNIEGKGRENCNYNIKNKIKILSKNGRILLLRKEVLEIVDLNCPPAVEVYDLLGDSLLVMPMGDYLDKFT